MSLERRAKWSRHIEQIIRSKHYTWLAAGLAGEPLEDALTEITTDIMHICEREGLSWEDLAERSRSQFELEEGQSATPDKMTMLV